MKEAAELRDPTEHYHAQPLEDNLFEWHFTVRGPPDSDFDGGVYHGRVVLPPDYPMKPPSIILLTHTVDHVEARRRMCSDPPPFLKTQLAKALRFKQPNGRFEAGKKICLSISGHHPETWQPSWSIRTALIAIIGFMPTKGEGAIGSLDYTPEERKALARKSQDFCCEVCGGSMRSALLPVTCNSNPSNNDREAKELARQISFKEESSSSSKAAQKQVLVSPVSSELSGEQASSSGTQTENPESPEVADSQTSPQSSPREETPQPRPLNRPLSPRQRRAQQQSQQPRRPASPTYPQLQRQPEGSSHVGLAVLIVVLTLALATLIFRRIYLASEYKFDYEL
ncbi:ubiquitin-conjugating enzyme E2 J1 isoform X2 [Polyodon spathula]|nr:ubiquitin-conjugating enzyme E2 J1 isoform X2 [Polyodon spathula]